MEKTNWQDFKIPSHHVIAVTEDKETGGYEVRADIAKVIRNVQLALIDGLISKDVALEDSYDLKDTVTTYKLGARDERVKFNTRLSELRREIEEGKI